MGFDEGRGRLHRKRLMGARLYWRHGKRGDRDEGRREREGRQGEGEWRVNLRDKGMKGDEYVNKADWRRLVKKANLAHEPYEKKKIKKEGLGTWRLSRGFKVLFIDTDNCFFIHVYIHPKRMYVCVCTVCASTYVCAFS